MAPRSSTRPRGRPRSRRIAGSVASLALASSLLAACSGDSGKPELVWYINPDAGGQAAVAEKCSTDEYTVTTQVLPQDASQQRIQLSRRLAAEDPSIDLMSLDPPFTAEFADAGFLADVPQDARAQLEEQGTFQGAMDAATWEDKLVVFPFWSNTQVLWYRKSFVDKTDLDMSQPVTWDQIIQTAADNGGKLGVQANKYEGYSVWINALVSGAGGQLVENADKGVDLDLTIDSAQGEDAAKVIEDLASSEAAPADLSVSNEGTAGSTFGGDAGSFMVNWTYIFHNYDETDPDVADDIGYTRYPQTVEGEESRPPYGGIGIGVSAFSDNKDLALEAAACLVEPENQGINAEMTGNMPASTAGYDYPALAELYPDDLRQLFQESVDAAAPRSVTPYWSDISSSLQSTWHPPASVNQDTPPESQDFTQQVLEGGRLL
ncbi:extracellular solute-binding protein [Nocardioides cavernae]|uniref:Extracellular solute-binding protein n=1 Tax=Nocardioides cavernae TaxID=1921566 RepID=A0ABR8N4C5_9ACTN|nr:extracellular solute-binding protein [Nocardioides cavernae]MBD3923015.1 extracellular solute-binding protein [Nocardioides cavernae]MBM7512065.1 multiple sugar transport system substrate-binding protein [Nocardioides cavernae]